MKILIMQLTRFGDILQTIPIVNALRRKHPQAEIHFLVREKYRAATYGFESFDKVIGFDTKSILGPVFEEEGFSDEQFFHSIERLEVFANRLYAEAYTDIYNLSFSPLSSYLTKYIESTSANIRGYSRFSDGFLNITDDASAYFYAQVGVGKFNQFHLIDVLASVADVDLSIEDYTLPFSCKRLLRQNYIVLHIGASHTGKQLMTSKWNQLIRKLLELDKDIVIIGSEAESSLADSSLSGLNSTKIHNLVGKTKFADLYDWIAYADLYIGCDSGPLHVCNFTDTKCLNFSNKEVKFWETGPKSSESFVYYEDQFDLFDVDYCFSQIKNIFSGKEVSFIKGSKWTGYESDKSDFITKMISALYTGSEFPESDKPKFFQALVQLKEVNNIIMHQLNHFREGDKEQFDVIQVAEQIMEDLAYECLDIFPLVKWFQTEKIRVGPCETPILIESYKELHSKLNRIMNIYLGEGWRVQEDML